MNVALESVRFPVCTVNTVSVCDEFSVYSTCLELCLSLIVQPNIIITGRLSQI